jgi:hypothetical protein
MREGVVETSGLITPSAIKWRIKVQNFLVSKGFN